MAVYDDEKNDQNLNELENLYSAPSATDKDLPEGHPSREDTSLEDAENAESDDPGKEASDNKEAKLNDDAPFAPKSGASEKGKKIGKLKGKLKKKLIIGGVLAGGGGVLIVLITLFVLSLKLPHFMENIGVYQFARLSRNFSRSVSAVTEERAAINAADEGFARSFSNKYTALRSKTWGKLDKYRPQKVLNNMQSSNQLEYLYRTEERRVKIPFFSDTKEVLDGVRIDGEEIRFGRGKWYQYFTNRADRLEFSGRLDAQIGTALSETNTLVRGSVAKKVREALGIELRRWEKLTKSYKSGLDAKADSIKKTREVTKTESPGSIVDDADTAISQVDEAADNCIEKPSCLENTAAGGDELQRTTATITDNVVKESVAKELVGGISSGYAVALPICLIYDGSVENSSEVVDANSNRAIKTYYSFASGADQQKAGDADTAQIGGLNDELGDVSKAPSELRAAGREPGEDGFTNPEAAGTGDYTIFDVLMPGALSGFANQVANTVCPTVTDIKVGIGLGGLELGLTFFSGGGSKAATTFLTRFIKEVFSKRTLGILARDTVLIGGATLLAKIIVLNHVGQTLSPIPSGVEKQAQADQGGNLVAGGIDRQQLHGRPMTKEEIAQSNYQDTEDIAYDNSQKSIFERYLDPGNPTSALSNTAISAQASLGGSLTRTAQRLFSKLGSFANIGKLLTDTLTWSGSRKVSAATLGNNYHIVQWGWTDAEEVYIRNNPDEFSPLNNAEIVTQNYNLDDLAKKYDKCFSQSIGELFADGLIVRDSDGNVVADGGDKALCSPDKLGPSNEEAFRYRLYMRNEATLDHLLALQDPETGAPAEEPDNATDTQTLETWAFCGVNPSDPSAQKAATTLHQAAGIAATMGPCMNPPSDYTTANPGSRYITPTEYMNLVKINATAGMKTVVYDARLWSSDDATRKAAYSFWAPVLSSIAAWDMGDEFGPDTPDWAILLARWNIMQTYTLPATNIKPFTNHLPFESVFTAAIRDLPNPAHFSFDSYDRATAVNLAGSLNSRVSDLMCAVNALQHGSLTTSAEQIKGDMAALKAAGCDSFLIFGGHAPYDTPGFPDSSLVDNSGNATSLAGAVLEGSKSTASTTSFIWPVAGKPALTSCWNEDRTGKAAGYFHSGLDMHADADTPVLAAAEGTIVFAANSNGLGNTLIIQHADGLYSQYQHLDTFSVGVGDTVTQGQVVAMSGNTGTGVGNGGYHMHFNIQRAATPQSRAIGTLNPLDFLPVDDRVMQFTRGTEFAPPELVGKVTRCVPSATDPKGWVVVP